MNRRESLLAVAAGVRGTMTRKECLLALQQEISALAMPDGVVCHANTQITNDDDIVLCFDHQKKQLTNWNSFSTKELVGIIAAKELSQWLAFRLRIAKDLFDDHEPATCNPSATA